MSDIEGQRIVQVFQDELALCGMDIAKLKAFEERLNKIDAHWVGPLRLKTINRKRIAKLGLPEPDGRPLFQYQFDQQKFQHWQRQLQEQVGKGHMPDAGIFVFWAAEWFRRRYKGGMLKWELLGNEIGLNCSQAEWRKLADKGLKYWGIEPLKTEKLHLRLLAIARQSGFPIAAVADGQNGWAYQFLTPLVARLSGSTRVDYEVAMNIARNLSGKIPEGWRNDAMLEVSVQLALAIIRLRAKAASAGLSLAEPISNWLDQNDPDWRKRLPLKIEGKASSLIDTLLQIKAQRGTGGSIRVRRYLKQSNNQDWLPYLAFEFDGTFKLPPSQRRIVDDNKLIERLRLHAAESLAKVTTGEMGVVLRPVKAGEVWDVKSSKANHDIIYPFDQAAKAETRFDGERIGDIFDLRGGERISGEMRIYEPQQNPDGNIDKLWLKSWNSGAFRSEEIVVEIPSDWEIINASETASILFEDDKRIFWHIIDEFIAENPQGDRFLIRPGQSERARDSIYFIDPELLQLFHEDGLPIFCGIPKPQAFNSSVDSSVHNQQIGWRRRGGRRWRYEKPPHGVVEFGWRDTDTGHLRAKKTCIILPSGFNISTVKNGDWLTITIDKWLNPIKLVGANQLNTNSWSVNIAKPSRDRLQLHFSIDEESFILQYPMPEVSWIAKWDGTLVAPKTYLSLASLSGYIARGNGMDLMVDTEKCNTSDRSQISRRWKVSDAIALSSIHDDIARMIRPLGIDAEVCLEFNDGRNNVWFVKEFEAKLTYHDNRGWFPDQFIDQAQAEVRGRPFADAASEKVLGNYSQKNFIDRNPITIPNLDGAWLVYLAAGNQILTRPRIMDNKTLNCQAHSRLGKIMSLADEYERTNLLNQMVEQIISFDDPSTAVKDIKSIIALISSLNGLPPITFDPISLLNERPELGPFLLFHADKTNMLKIWSISDGLLFDWTMVPYQAWKKAYDSLGHYLDSTLSENPEQSVSDRMTFILQCADSQWNSICDLSLWMAAMVNYQEKPKLIEEINEDMIERSGDRINSDNSNPFRPELASNMLNHQFSSGIGCVIDAPWAAALASSKGIELTQKQILTIKNVHQRHPKFFAEAYICAIGKLNE